MNYKEKFEKFKKELEELREDQRSMVDITGSSSFNVASFEAGVLCGINKALSVLGLILFEEKVLEYKGNRLFCDVDGTNGKKS